MKIKVTIRDDRGMDSRTFKADRWCLDDHQNLILKKGESDIALVGADYWVSVEVVEDE